MLAVIPSLTSVNALPYFEQQSIYYSCCSLDNAGLAFRKGIPTSTLQTYINLSVVYQGTSRNEVVVWQGQLKF